MVGMKSPDLDPELVKSLLESLASWDPRASVPLALTYMRVGDEGALKGFDAMALANPLARITFIRGSLIIPFLLVLVFIGSFAANNSLSDIVTLIGVGLFGYVLKASDWPRIPLVLGLILGKQAEKYFTISFSLSSY